MTPAEPADRATLIRRATFDLDWPAAQRRGDRRVCRRHRARRVCQGGRIVCSIRRTMASAGDAIGSTWPATPTRRDTCACRKSGDFPTPSRIATTSFARSTRICPTIDSSSSNWRPTNWRRPTEHGSLAALGFLTLGRRFTGNKHDIIDDRIDVVTRGLLGLTVTCARCHDHKYDPIPTADYYSLYGVFASSDDPIVPPLIAPVGSDAAAQALRARAGGTAPGPRGIRIETVRGAARRLSRCHGRLSGQGAGGQGAAAAAAADGPRTRCARSWSIVGSTPSSGPTARPGFWPVAPTHVDFGRRLRSGRPRGRSRLGRLERPTDELLGARTGSCTIRRGRAWTWRAATDSCFRARIEAGKRCSPRPPRPPRHCRGA